MAIIDVVLVAGLSGSGKTTISGEVVRLTGFAYYDKDVTEVLVDAALEGHELKPGDRDSPFYVENLRPPEYEILQRHMAANVRLGNSCIADAPFVKEFASQEWRMSFEQRLNKAKEQSDTVRVHYVWLEVDGDVLKQQLEKRGSLRDEYKLKNWTAWFTAQTMRPLQPCLIVNATDRSSPMAHALEIINKLKLPMNMEALTRGVRERHTYINPAFA